MPVLGGILRRAKKQETEVEAKPSANKIYLKAVPLRDLADLDKFKEEVKAGNILILRITPLASQNIDDVKKAINELCEFVESIGGDIARLGEERVVICPPNVRVWREKTPISNEAIPTAA